MYNILDSLNSGEMTLADAEEIYDGVMDSDHGGKVAEILGLTPEEYTALGHGVWLDELASWRTNGWPCECPFCGRRVNIEAYHWKIATANGRSSVAHLACE